jgi:hypothetical protein
MPHHWHDGQPNVLIINPHHLRRVGVAVVHECSGSAAAGIRLLDDHSQAVERLGLSQRVEPSDHWYERSDVNHHHF